jgi:hypothetical protein
MTWHSSALSREKVKPKVTGFGLLNSRKKPALPFFFVRVI